MTGPDDPKVSDPTASDAIASGEPRRAMPGQAKPSDWREFSVGLELPDRAFGAAVGVDDLLLSPDLHFAATASTSRLMLMPRADTFTRLALEWETLPEIGVFTAHTLGSDPFTSAQKARLEQWLRDVATTLHTQRDTIRVAAERAVRDASSGLDRSMPERVDDRSTLVAARFGTRVHGVGRGREQGWLPSGARGYGDQFGEWDAVSTSTGSDIVFVSRQSGDELGRRRSLEPRPDIVGDAAGEAGARGAGEHPEIEWIPARAGITPALLADLFEQHVDREVLFDDVWQVYVHLLAGLEAPANVQYFTHR